MTADPSAVPAPTSASVVWRPLEPGDLDAVVAIAAVIHPSMPERAAVFDEKRRLCPEGARLAVRDGRPVGYGFAHPWRLGAIPKLDTFLTSLPDAPDCVFVHDVALLPEARGHGLALSFVAEMKIFATTRGIGALACVSVYGTTVLWSKAGFAIEERPELAPALEGYGETARYMVAKV